MNKLMNEFLFEISSRYLFKDIIIISSPSNTVYYLDSIEHQHSAIAHLIPLTHEIPLWQTFRIL